MKFLRINEAQIINLDAIASISAGQQGSNFTLCIRYLVRGKEGEETGLAYETFTGKEAAALYEFFGDPSRCVDLSDWME